MKIITYRTELSAEKLPCLVKEAEHKWENSKLDTPGKIVDMINEVFHLSRQTEESAILLGMTNSCQPIGVFEISRGTIDASLCQPREILMKALCINAPGLILLHNHPSGNCTPSQSDKYVAERIEEVCPVCDRHYAWCLRHKYCDCGQALDFSEVKE